MRGAQTNSSNSYLNNVARFDYPAQQWLPVFFGHRLDKLLDAAVCGPDRPRIPSHSLFNQFKQGLCHGIRWPNLGEIIKDQDFGPFDLLKERQVRTRILSESIAD